MQSIQIKTFQELTLQELYSILKLRVDVFVVEQNCPYHEVDGADMPSIHFFYKEKEEVVSYLRVIPLDQELVKIGRVVTHAKFRGQKRSAQLMESALEYIHAQFPNKTIMLSAQAHLQHFYGSFGFDPVSEVYLEDNIPHVDMKFIE